MIEKYEYLPGELDFDQVCHCCGETYVFDLAAEQMYCTNRVCSTYKLRFTIPYKRRVVEVKHRGICPVSVV